MLNRLNVHHVQSAWPSTSVSTIQLLGLFQDEVDSPDPEFGSPQFSALFKAAIVLSQRYNITIDGQWIGWHVEQTNGKLIDTLRKTCLVVSASNVVGIVGPRLSREAHTIATFAGALGIPVVSYTATDPDLSSRNAYRSFYRTIPSDASAAFSMVQLFKRFNWTSCMIIYQNDAYGYSGMRVISEEFMRNDVKVREMIKFDIETRTTEGNLRHYLLNSPTRIVILWAVPTVAKNILQHALDQDLLGPHFLWILSSRPSLHSFTKESSEKLVGILTVEPVTGSVLGAPINVSLLKAAYEVWQEYESDSFPGEDKVDQYALFAFDATWLLIQSLQRFCAMTDAKMTGLCVSFLNASLCFDRHLANADSFLEHITSTAFLGVTGPIEYNGNGTDRSKGIHYIGKSLRSLAQGLGFVPVLKYGESNAWETYHEPSTIIWPGGSCTIPSDRAVLSGINLRIGIIPSSPFADVEHTKGEFGNNATNVTGYVPDLIELLRGKMNFIPNITMLPKSSYTKYVHAVANGEYDMVIGDLTVTAKRREIISFSTSIFDDSLSIVIRKPTSIDLDLFSYLKPFSGGLWMIILVATVYASVVICLLERRENVALRDRSIMSTAGMSVWYSIGTIMGYGADFQATTVSGRLLTVALYILSLVLVATYTANLASNLTLARPKYIINGIDDIKKGKLPYNRIGVLENTAIEQFYLREVSQGRQNFYSARSRQDILDSLLNKRIDAALLDTAIAEYITNEIYCNLTLVGGPLNDDMFGIGIPKNWPYEQDLDMNILSLREGGQLDHLKSKWFQTRKCQDSNDMQIAIQIESMAGLFLTVGVITLFALLSFAWRKRSIIKNYFFTLKTRVYNAPPRMDLSNRSF